MRQRLAIAQAMQGMPDLLVLDEPTNGLDPQGTREVRSLIRSLSAEGITIFISSHLLIEIEQICTHLAVMSAGEIVAQGSLEELAFSETLNLSLNTPDTQQALLVLQGIGIDAHLESDVIRAGIAHDLIAADQIVQALTAAKVRVQGFTLLAPTLEDRFVLLTGEGFDVLR